MHAEAPGEVLHLTLDVVGMADERDIWPLHAGVNVGRVVQRDGDLFGTAVNEASRIAGEAKIKNISVPVELFRARRFRVD